jgi:GntR family transcriptional regulator
VLCVIEFRIERRSGTAAYAQIVHQVRDAVLLGRLHVGDQLPTAREVVAATGINPNTVLKAYRQLDVQGVVETRAGAGTFVIAVPERVVDESASPLAGSLRAWLVDARDAGLDRPAVEALVKAQLDRTFREERV